MAAFGSVDEFERLSRRVGVECDRFSVGEFTGQYLGSDWIFNSLLNHPLERPSAKCGIIPFLGKQLQRGIGEGQLQMTIGEPRAQVIQLHIDNPFDLLARNNE